MSNKRYKPEMPLPNYPQAGKSTVGLANILREFWAWKFSKKNLRSH